MITYNEGYDYAKSAGLESQYMALIADGFTPQEALQDLELKEYYETEN